MDNLNGELIGVSGVDISIIGNMTYRPFKLKVAFPWWKWIVNPLGMWKVKKYMRCCENLLVKELDKPEMNAELELRLYNLRVYGCSHPEMYSYGGKTNGIN